MMILKSTLCKAMLCIFPVLLMGCGSSGSSSSEPAKVTEKAASSESSVAKESLDSIIVTEDAKAEELSSETPLVEEARNETPIVNGAIVNESIVEEESSAQTDTSSNTDNSPGTSESEQASEVDLHISWSDNSENEVEFIIERRIQSNVDYGVTYYVAENTTSYNDEGVQVGETYCYRVSASNSIGKSSSSEQCIEL